MANVTDNGLHRPPRETGNLTNRELQCLQALASGMNNGGIATHLGISLPTVAMHLTNARRKLGAITRTQAVAMAVGRGLIPN